MEYAVSSNGYVDSSQLIISSMLIWVYVNTPLNRYMRNASSNMVDAAAIAPYMYGIYILFTFIILYIELGILRYI